MSEAAQFVFLAFYSHQQNADVFKEFNLAYLDKGKVLDIYIANPDYPFYLQYASYLDDLKPKNTVCPDYWATPREYLPHSIKSWMASDQEGLKLAFLKRIGVNFEDSEIVKIRKGMKEGLEISAHQFELVREKSNTLLFDTMNWLNEKAILLQSAAQVTASVRLLENYYANVPYNEEHPQLFFSTLDNDSSPVYEFKPSEKSALQLSNSAAHKLRAANVAVSDIFAILKNSGRSLLAATLYPEQKQSNITLAAPVIIDEPDYDNLYQQSDSFDLPFFVNWAAINQLKFLFINGQIPRKVTFESKTLRTYRFENYERDPARGIIYLNVDLSQDISEKARQIVMMIKHQLPAEYLTENQKEFLGAAHHRWTEGENPDVSDILKKQVGESELYSFEWLKAMFDWEYDASGETSGQLRLSFARVELADGQLVLSSCNYETIPVRVEYHSDTVLIKLKNNGKERIVACRLVKYAEFELTFAFESSTDIEYFRAFRSLDDFTASFSLRKEDVLMSALRDGLFGSRAIAPKEGDIRDYLKDRIADRRLSFLFGPPGTGKTTKLAIDILLTLADGRKTGQLSRILVLTPTNKAADVVLERILQLIYNRKRLSDAAAAYYDEERRDQLLGFCEQITQTGLYRDILVRFGGSNSEILLQHDILQDRSAGPITEGDLVFVTTIHRLSYDSYGNLPLHSPHQNWGYVVVDESSMVPLPHTVFMLLRFADLPEVSTSTGLRSTFLFSGDPFQIQPVGKTPNYLDQGKEDLKGWSTENIYTLFGLSNFSMTHTPVGNFFIEKLMKQYRSVPSLGQLFSKYRYDDMIEHDQQSDAIDIALGEQSLDNINFVEFNIFDAGTVTQEDIYTIHKFGEFSAYHIYSIVLACELASALKLQYPEKSVSIISPYGTQARLTKEISYAFKARNPENSFDVSTVHRYQGDESDIVLLVMNPPKVNTYPYSHFNNKFLINVGISRAKQALIIMHPKEVSGYSEIDTVIRTIPKRSVTISSSKLEHILFPEHGIDSSALEKMVQVSEFQSFNVSDLLEFKASGKEYFFFADSRETEKNSRKHVNVILDLQARMPLTKYLFPEVGIITDGLVESIHISNRSASIWLKKMNCRGDIHSDAVASSYVSDIGSILSLGQQIRVRISAVTHSGISLSMIGVDSDKVDESINNQ